MWRAIFLLVCLAFIANRSTAQPVGSVTTNANVLAACGGASGYTGVVRQHNRRAIWRGWRRYHAGNATGYGAAGGAPAFVTGGASAWAGGNGSGGAIFVTTP